MATVNFIKCAKQGRAAMMGTMDYLRQDFKVAVQREKLKQSHAETFVDMDEEFRKTLDYGDCVKLVSGKDCCAETAYNEFMAVNANDKMNENAS